MSADTRDLKWHVDYACSIHGGWDREHERYLDSLVESLHDVVEDISDNEHAAAAVRQATEALMALRKSRDDARKAIIELSAYPSASAPLADTRETVQAHDWMTADDARMDRWPALKQSIGGGRWCFRCGVAERRDGKNKPCKGTLPKVVLREAESASAPLARVRALVETWQRRQAEWQAQADWRGDLDDITTNRFRARAAELSTCVVQLLTALGETAQETGKQP